MVTPTPKGYVNPLITPSLTNPTTSTPGDIDPNVSAAMRGMGTMSGDRRSQLQSGLTAIANGGQPAENGNIIQKAMGLPGIKQGLNFAESITTPLGYVSRTVGSTVKQGLLLPQGKGSTSKWKEDILNKDWGAGSYINSGNKWIDRAGGFLGDVAMDPLTYTTLGSGNLGSLGQKAATAARLVDKGTEPLRAARVAREGTWFLTATEREAAGLKQAGVYFMGKRVAGTGGAGQFGERAFAKSRMLVGDSPLGEMMRKAFTPKDFQDARNLLKRGAATSDEQALRAIEVIRSRDTLQNAAAESGQAVSQAWGRATEGIDRSASKAIQTEITHAMENPALLSSASDLTRNLHPKARQIFDDLHSLVSGATKRLDGATDIGYTKNYMPHSLTDYGKKAIKGDKKLMDLFRVTSDDLRQAGFVEPRRLVADGKTTLFGKVLEPEDLNIRSLNEIGKTYGGLTENLFEDNFWKLVDGYNVAHSGEMGRLARMQHLFDSGVGDYVISKNLGDKGLIRDSLARTKAHVGHVKEATAKSVSATNSLREAATSALERLQKTISGDIAGQQQAQINGYRSVMEARDAARSAIDDLQAARDALASLHDPSDLGDINLAGMLQDQIDQTQKNIELMTDNMLQAVEDSRNIIADDASTRKSVEDLRDFANKLQDEINSLTETTGKTALLHEYLSANLTRMISGKDFDDAYETIIGAVQEVYDSTQGYSKTVRGSKLKNPGRNAVQTRLSEADWFKGVTRTSPISESTVYAMTGEKRAKLLRDAVHMSSSLHDMRTVGANIIARNEAFYASRGLQLPEEVVDAHKLLVAQIDSAGFLQQQIRRDLSTGSGRKIDNRLAQAESKLRLMYKDKDTYDGLVAHVEDLDKRASELIIRKNTGHPVDGIQFEEIASQRRMAVKSMSDLEGNLYTVGSGATQKSYSLSSVDNQGSIADLEAYSTSTELRIEAVEPTPGQQKAINKAIKTSAGSLRQQRDLATALERAHVVGEVWRRSIGVDELLAEVGLKTDENHIRMIAQAVVSERQSIWEQRILRHSSAESQWRELEVVHSVGLETGDMRPFEEVKKRLLGDNAKETSLKDLLQYTNVEQSSDQINSIAMLWKDLTVNLPNQSRAVRMQTKPGSAFGELSGIRELSRAVDPEITDDLLRRTLSTQNVKAEMDATSHQLVLWFEQTQKMPASSYRTIDGQKILTRKGREVMERRVSEATMSALDPRATRSLVDTAKIAVDAELASIRPLQKMFRDVLDPRADISIALADGHQTTPLKLARLMDYQATNIERRLEDFYAASESGAKTARKARSTANTLQDRGYEINAGLEPRDPMAFDYKVDVPTTEKASNRSLGARAQNKRVEQLAPFANDDSRVNIGNVIDERFKANQKIAEMSSSPQYQSAVQAQSRYELLQRLAYNEMGGTDVSYRLGEFIKDSMPNFNESDIAYISSFTNALDDAVFTPNEWESLFVSDVGIKARGIATKEVERLQGEIRATVRKIKGAPTASVRSRFANQLETLQGELETATTRRSSMNPDDRFRAIEKLALIDQAIDEVVTATGIPRGKIESAVFRSRPSTADMAQARKGRLESGWSASNERVMLEKHAELVSSPGNQSRLSALEEVEILERRYQSLVERGAVTKRQAETAIADARSESASLVGRIDGMAGEPNVPLTSGLDIGTSGQAQRASGVRLQNFAEATKGYSKRIVKSEESRLRSMKVRVTLSPEGQEALDKLARIHEAQGSARMLANSTEQTLNDPKYAGKLKLANDVSAKQWQPAIDFANDALNGRVTAGGRKYKGLYEELAVVNERMAKPFEDAMGKLETARARLTEMQIAFGNAELGLEYANSAAELYVPLLQQKLETVKTLLDTIPEKLAKDADAVARNQITDWAETANRVIKDMTDSPDDAMTKIGADALIQEWMLINHGNAVRTEEILLGRLKDGFGGSVVPQLKEGWTRLGAYTKEETKGLKELKKGIVKGDPARKLAKPGNVLDVGLGGMQVPDEVARWMTNIERNLGGPFINSALDFLSGYTRFFKAYATATPGFHVRNAMSDMFQMLAADANPKNLSKGLTHFREYKKNPEAYVKTLSGKELEHFQNALYGQRGAGSGRVEDALSKFRTDDGSILTNNVVLRTSKRLGKAGEDARRFMLAYDSSVKGLDRFQTSERVKRYLFDYNNPSPADEAILKIVPFWTWMSRNLPLQLTNRLVNPRAYAAYQHFVENFDQSEPGDMTPGYMQEQGAINLGGGNMLMPDLPFTRVNKQIEELGNPSRLLSYVNPALRLPFELTGGTKYYNNQPFSKDPQPIEGPMKLAQPLLALLGQVDRGADGKAYTTDKAKYAVSSVIPTIAQSERLFPSNAIGQEKRGSNVASWFGAPIKQNTPMMVENERKRRQAAMTRYVNSKKDLG